MVTRKEMKEGKTGVIVVSTETRNKLKTYATNLDSTYDSILKELMAFWDENH